MAKKTHNYITHNIHYIDYCIEQLKKDSALHDDTLKELIDHLLYNTLLPSHFSKSTLEACNDLQRIIQKWDILEYGDIGGYIYQRLKNSQDKKRRGQYFTPPAIVEYITTSALQHHDNPFSITILDPACGSGQFLIFAFKILLNLFIHIGIDRTKAAHHICTNNLYGYDIDPIACTIARWNLYKISGTYGNIYQKDTLFVEERCSRTIPSHYDVIIGNPPWGAHVSATMKEYYKTHYFSAQSGINSFTLFIERSIALLKESGVLSFLLPESYLNTKAHRCSRQLVLSHCCIKEIVQWGDCFKGVYAPAISLTLQKDSNAFNREKNIITIKHAHSLTTHATRIPQHVYSNSWENIFSIHYSRKALALLEHIETLNYFTLQGRAKFFLGIVTGDNTYHIASHQDEAHPDPIIIGKDVQKYRINFSNHYFKYNIQTLQQVADQHLYLTKNKVVYKFIGKNLTFAVDTHGYYVLNNVNGLIPLDEAIDPDILVAILNSSLLQYIYQTHFFTVKVLRSNLEKLPIKKISSSNAQLLKKLSQTLRDTNSTSLDKRLLETIDDIIFHEYHITDIHAYTIINSLSHYSLQAG